mgnify:CR=1 FL=1
MKKPSNPKLYAIIVAQARAKYSTYPSPGASAWVHKQYVNHGGQFTETNEEDRKKKIAQKKFAHEKSKHMEEKHDAKKKGEKK